MKLFKKILLSSLLLSGLMLSNDFGMEEDTERKTNLN